MRTLLIALMAAVLVAAIALVVGFCGDDPLDSTVGDPDAGGPDAGGSSPGGSGTATAPTVASAPELVQPSKDEWAELLPRLEAAVEAAPDDINAQRKLALAYYNLSRFDEAAALYEHLLAAEEDAVLRARLGNALRDMGDLAGAEAAYRQAITDDPTLAPPYLDLAELLWRQGRDEEALEVIDEGLEAVPEENRATLEQGREALERSVP